MRISVKQDAVGFQIRLTGSSGEFDLALTMLKITVPHRLRRFESGSKSWQIERRAKGALMSWLLFCKNHLRAQVIYDSYCGEAEWKRQVNKINKMQLAESYRMLHLLPSAPAELVKAAHKIMAKLNHPDLGGDIDTMQRINAAFDSITVR
jgi:hypothetical protein